MHEFSIITNIFAIIEKTAKENNLAKVRAVYLKVGKLRQLVPEFLQFAFQTVSKDTIAANAVLHIEEIPVKMHCKFCGYKFIVDDQVYHCPKCQRSDLDMLSGDEIMLDSIES